MINRRCDNSFNASLVIEELVRNGVVQFYISPGSRSTPLTLAAAENPNAIKTICYDERGAAYAAVGYARTGKPAALICTSGTAVANYLPAVVEASYDRLPLIILTADRPPELWECSANQTIDQVNIFEKYTRRNFNFPAAESGYPRESLLSSVDYAVFTAKNSPAGPVHLNFSFREPLISDDEVNDISDNINKWEKSGIAFTQYSAGNNIPDEKTIENISAKLKNFNNIIIIAGRMRKSADSEAVLKLSESLNLPLFPDILSRLKFSSSDKVINYYDRIINQGIQPQNPDFILHFGGPVISKALQQYLERTNPPNYFLVNNDPVRIDQGNIVKNRIVADIEYFCDSIDLKTGSGEYLESWAELNIAAQSALNTHLQAGDDLSEIALPADLLDIISSDELLFLASSMPIRDFDMFPLRNDANTKVAANRGASGIDGVISSACGFAAGNGADCTLVCGDLSALHDLNGLELASKIREKLTIIIINNHGGGIFNFLPVSGEEHFREYFSTPHNLGFENAAAMFGLDYYKPANRAEFREQYTRSGRSGRSCIIELITNRDRNFEEHRNFRI